MRSQAVSVLRQSLLAVLVIGGGRSAGAEPQLRFVQNRGGITISNSLQSTDGGTQAGRFSLRKSTSEFADGVKSIFKRKETPQAEPRSPDPWTNSKKAKDPDAHLYVEFARLQEQANNFPNAEINYRLALAKDPKNLEALLALAHLQERMGQPSKAIDLYQKAVTYHPQEAAAHNDLGLCYLGLGQLPTAIVSFERAIAIDPNRKLYRNNIARPLVGMGRLDDAYKHLIAVYPPAVTYYNLGYLLSERRDYRGALEHFQKALEIDPNFVEARQWSAQLAAKLGGPRLAERPHPPRRESFAPPPRTPQPAPPAFQPPLTPSAGALVPQNDIELQVCALADSSSAPHSSADQITQGCHVTDDETTSPPASRDTMPALGIALTDAPKPNRANVPSETQELACGADVNELAGESLNRANSMSEASTEQLEPLPQEAETKVDEQAAEQQLIAHWSRCSPPRLRCVSPVRTRQFPRRIRSTASKSPPVFVG